MFYVMLVVVLFMGVVASHILFCRRAVKGVLHSKAFLMISVIGLTVYIAMVFGLPLVFHLDPATWWGMPLALTSTLVYLLFIPLYLTFYVLSVLMSPSKKILLTLSCTGGASYDQILAVISQERFIHSRLDDLGVSGCVIQKESRYTLTPAGNSIAVTLNVMQVLFGRNIGG